MRSDQPTPEAIAEARHELDYVLRYGRSMNDRIDMARIEVALRLLGGTVPEPAPGCEPKAG